jgi:hypothetical protein
LRVWCGVDMIWSRRRQRRRTSDERLGDGRPGRRAAKVERSPQEHQIEVRRRNGRCKPARTRADRTLVLTEAGRGNSDGFVAFTGLLRALRANHVRCARRFALECLWNARNAVDNDTFLWRKRPDVLRRGASLHYDACTSTSGRLRAARSLPARVASRKAPAPRRRYRRDDIRRPPGRARSARTRADRFSCITKPPSSARWLRC